VENFTEVLESIFVDISKSIYILPYNQNKSSLYLYGQTRRIIRMKTVKSQLKALSKNLVSLSKQVDKLATQVDKAKPAAKTAAKRAPVKKRKAVAPKRVKKARVARGGTVLDSVLSAIKRSKKGVAIAQLKAKTGLDPRQLSNALYKLSKKGTIVTKSRGIYVAK
jgi:predicted butyrate kinase (DUF1464 family)